jgi:hypothetical protein
MFFSIHNLNSAFHLPALIEKFFLIVLQQDEKKYETQKAHANQIFLNFTLQNKNSYC